MLKPATEQEEVTKKGLETAAGTGSKTGCSR